LIFYQKYNCQARYPVGNPASGPYRKSGWISSPYRISGWISGIRLDIRYPAFGLAGCPAKTVSGASLINYIIDLLVAFD
jgi:hypothetical protein